MNEGGSPQTVSVTASGGADVEFDAVVRIDTPGELGYYRHGGIMPYVLRSIRNR
jgi:aconitate hydratase